jgi:1-phosphofructokinase family hexose kinase
MFEAHNGRGVTAAGSLRIVWPVSAELASLIRAAAGPETRCVPDGGGPVAPATIRVVGPNPAVDRIEILDDLHVDAVNRSVEVLTRAGGKSLNLARAIRRLGLDVSVYGFLGGWTGTFVRDACAAHGLTDRHTTIAGETRISLVLVEPATGVSTVINEPGPVVTAPEAAALLDRLSADCRAGDIAVLSGSLARGLPVDFHAEIVRRGQAAGARVIVDTSGPALAAAVEARPWMVKPNLAEFAHLIGRDLRSDRPDAVLAEMRMLVDAGIETVVVTLGQHGLLYADAESALRVHSPRIVAKNPTGSGDILLAGFVAARAAGADVVAALRIGVSAAAASCARIEPDIGPADALALLPQTLVDAAEAVLPGTGGP